jgi:hypothetical protein
MSEVLSIFALVESRSPGLMVQWKTLGTHTREQLFLPVACSCRLARHQSKNLQLRMAKHACVWQGNGRTSPCATSPLTTFEEYRTCSISHEPLIIIQHPRHMMSSIRQQLWSSITITPLNQRSPDLTSLPPPSLTQLLLASFWHECCQYML